MKAVRLPSPAHAPRLTDLPHWSLPPPRSQPIHLASGRAAQSRAISRYLGRSRGRAALSRAISERRSRGGTPAQKRKGPVGATGLTCSLGAPPHSAPLLRRWRRPVRRHPARRVPRPPRRPLRAPLIFSPLGVTLALTQGNPAGLPSPHLRRVRSVLRPLAPVHIACPPAKAGAKAKSTAKAGARAKSTA